MGTAGSHWTSISANARHVTRVVTQTLKDARAPVERAIMAPQVSSVDLLIVAITDEAIEDIQFAAPDRWRTAKGHTALSETELAAIRARLGQVATAGHAAALGHYEIVLRPGEELGLSTHRKVKIARSKASGDVEVLEAFVTTHPLLKLDRMDLFCQELNVSAEIFVRPTHGNGYLAKSPVQVERLRINAGDSMMLIVRNSLSIDRRAVEQEGSETLSLDHQHRLLLITPSRRPRPKSNKQIAKDLGLPQLAN
jgi:hypothetical protein